MSNAITNRIKTYFTLFYGKETGGELPQNPNIYPLRVNLGGTTLAGTAETIESEITIPESRIPSTPEVGSESNSGDIQTEWNIDEQDDLFEGVFGDTWKADAENPNKKSITLGDDVKSFTMMKYYSQAPKAWQLFKKEYINQLTIDLATDEFVKLTWSVMGSNNPEKVFSDPLASLNPVYKDALKTKSFLTKTGFVRIGDTVDTLQPLRQCPSMSTTINNNLERTPALFEEESIENSLGDFDVSGTLDMYNADDIAHTLYNDAVKGTDKVIQVQVKRQVRKVTTSYTLTMNVHLSAPSESRNGNKLQFSLPFQVNDTKDLSLVKEVVSDEVVNPDTPVINSGLEDVTCNQGDSVTLDGTATVSDGGTLSYSWKKGSDEVATTATYKPSTAAASESDYKLTVTNTLNGQTATATKTVTVIVTPTGEP